MKFLLEAWFNKERKAGRLRPKGGELMARPQSRKNLYPGSGNRDQRAINEWWEKE